MKLGCSNLNLHRILLKQGKIMKKIIMLLSALVLAGCSSSPYVYHVEPTQLQSNETQYDISSVKVNLVLGHGAITGDDSFVNEAALKKQFEDALVVAMKEKGIYGKASGYSVVVDIDYKRTFNLGGKALNKPEVSHTVSIIDAENKKLASFAAGKYTTSYGTFGNAAVNIQIASFTWGAEDELKDVKVVAEVIVNQLADLGN